MDRKEVLQFRPWIYTQVSQPTQQAMHVIEQSLPHVSGVVQEFTEQKFKPLDVSSYDSRHVHNMLVDAIFRSSMLKQYLLNASIVRSVNSMDFLSYALAGRALIETTATLRYYLYKKIQPVVDKCVQSKLVQPEDLAELIAQEDRLLRGGRFDWLKFYTSKLDELQEAYIVKQQEKKDRGKKKATQVGSQSGLPLEYQQHDQINVQTCIESWAKDFQFESQSGEPKYPPPGVIYDLFCDMVHPNVGSLLCISIAEFDSIVFKFPEEGQSPVGLT